MNAKQKRLIALLLTAIMLAAILAGCSGGDASDSVASGAIVSTGVADSPSNEVGQGEQENQNSGNAAPEAMDFPLEELTTLTMYYPWAPPFFMLGYDSPNDELFEVTALYEQLTNVHIEFESINIQYLSEKFNLMVATGEYPDLLNQCMDVYTGGAAQAIEDEVIIPINDLIAEYAPNYTAFLESDSTFAKENKLDTGEIWQFMSINDNAHLTQGFIMREDWLGELNMDSPETFDDWYDYLSACVTNYGCTDAITTTVPETGGYYTGWYVEDGTVKYGWMETEQVTKYMEINQKWFDAGIFNLNVFIDTFYEDSKKVALLTTGGTAVMERDIDQYKLYNESGETEGYSFISVASPVLNKGDTPKEKIPQGIYGNGVAVTTSCKIPEIAVAYLDFGFTEKSIELKSWGIEGTSFELDSNGSPYFTEAVLNYVEGVNLALSVYCLDHVPSVVDWDRKFSYYTDEQVAAARLWSNRDKSTTYPSSIKLAADISGPVATTMTDVSTYISENYSKFITREWNMESDLEAFQNNIMSLGLDTAVTAYQDAYDRYMAR